MPRNELYYGDNLDILRRKIPSASVDLCYIDPPFNSKRTYFQITPIKAAKAARRLYDRRADIRKTWGTG